MVASNKHTNEKCMDCNNELVSGEGSIYWTCVKPTFLKEKAGKKHTES